MIFFWHPHPFCTMSFSLPFIFFEVFPNMKFKNVFQIENSLFSKKRRINFKFQFLKYDHKTIFIENSIINLFYGWVFEGCLILYFSNIYLRHLVLLIFWTPGNCFYLRGREILEEVVVLDGILDQSPWVEVLIHLLEADLVVGTHALTWDSLLLVESNLAGNAVAVLVRP